MNFKGARWLWVIVAVQVVFLLGWAGYHEVIRQTAPTIRLRTLPVDPRDIIRGDYMTLDYDIGRPDASVKRPAELRGDVWVALKPDGRFHVIDEIRDGAPPEEDGRLWVNARVWGAPDNPRIDYGIEHFFVPEGRGTPEFTTMEVDASVSATRRLYLRRVWVDGKRFP